MARLLSLRNSIVNTLRADSRYNGAGSLPKIFVSHHDGEWDYEEIRRSVKQTPAVILAPLMATIEKVPTTFANVRCVAVAFVEDKKALPKEDLVIDIADLVLRTLNSSAAFWGLDWLQRPRQIKARNMFSVKAHKDGVALWGVEWTQSIELQDEASEDDPVTMVEYTASWFAPGLIGADYDGTEGSTGPTAEPYARDVGELSE